MEKESGWLYTDILQIAGNQANRAFGSLNGGFPTHTNDGSWVDDADFNWARGYYPGILWLIYQGTGDTTAINLASSWMPDLAPLKRMDDQDGLGMIFSPTYVTAYQITGNRDYRQVALDAAEVASKRCTEAGYFPAWGAAGDTVLSRRLSIETLMDLELLYWASEASGNPLYERQATDHAIFTIGRLIDGSGRILALADFDPKTGAIFGERTPELADNPMYGTRGHSASSVWAQGQAYAIYGLASAYKHDQQPLFLSAATRAADYLVAHLPDDGVPNWDFELPEGQARQKDTAAASVAAAGLLKLARQTADAGKRQVYRDTAARIMTQLNNSYLNAEQTGLLQDGIWTKQGNSPLSGATSWGDFYYVEALLLLQDIRA